MLAIGVRGDLATLPALICKAEHQRNWIVVRRADGADDREASSAEQNCRGAEISPSSVFAYTLDCALENDIGLVNIFTNSDSTHMAEVSRLHAVGRLPQHFCLFAACRLPSPNLIGRHDDLSCALSQFTTLTQAN